MKPRVGIIGCGGVGWPLAKQLVQGGYSVVGTTTREARLASLDELGVASVLLDLRTHEGALPALLQSIDIAVVTLPPSRIEQGMRDYPEQLRYLDQQFEANNVSAVLFTSSTDIYPQNGEWVTEEDAAMITPRFTSTPVLALEQIFSHNPAYQATHVRFAGLMGEGYSEGAWVAGREIKGADDRINMVHKDDCVAIMQRIIQRAIWNECFNVVADEHPTKAEFYNRLCDLRGLQRPVFVEGESAYRLVSNEKVKRMLGHTFIHPDPIAALVQS